MPTDQIVWPKKTREFHNHHFDSTVWNDFRFRDDDIVIATYAKSGTTWLQQIVGQLIWQGAEGVPVAELSPWLDIRIMPNEAKLRMMEAQRHRRFIKTHLPVDALVFSPKARYLYIARDGRDVVWSFHNHHANANEGWYKALNETPGLVGPPIAKPVASIRRYFLDWLEKDGFPFWPYWENIRGWWQIRHLPNVLLLHYADLKQDLAGQIRQIAAFIDNPVSEENWPRVIEHCTFDYMKAHAAESVPGGGAFFEGGAETFLHSGANKRWQNTLTEEDIRRYEETAVRELGQECANWLAKGAG